jgi:hypothetical protein
MKDREQPLPPTAVVGFNSEAGAAKDRSPIANIDRDRALISFKEMPITPVEANHDAGEVACGEIGGLAVERARLINYFERRQKPVLLGIVEFDGFICEPYRNRRQRHALAYGSGRNSALRKLGLIRRKLPCSYLDRDRLGSKDDG